MNIPKEFIINRQGKDMVLYTGLLALAHQAGVKSIRTSVYQPPLEGNDRIAICTAVVTMKDGSEWSGVGDACASNVNRNIGPHIIRMAETRAKARALRDALNIAMVAAEEVADDEHEPTKPTPIRQTVTRDTVDQAAQTVAATAGTDAAMVQRERLGTLRAEVERRKYNWDTYTANWQNKVGSPIEQASVDQLTAAIEKLRGTKNGRNAQ